MAAAVGMIGRGCGGSSWLKEPKKKTAAGKKSNERVRVCCSASAVSDPYKTLRIQPGASESEVKKAFRQLALQYHPDVCRGSNCGVQFHRINEAYDATESSDSRSTAQVRRRLRKSPKSFCGASKAPF